MRKILIFFLVLSLTPITWAQKVQVLSGVTPPKKQEMAIYQAYDPLNIDDEMLPTSTDYYRFEVCKIGQEAIAVQVQQELPAQRGPAAKAVKAITPQHYKIKEYRPVRKCKYYNKPNTPLSRSEMTWDITHDPYMQVPNGKTIQINMVGYLGNPYASFVVIDKAMMPYTIPYNEMPKGSVLKKILTDQGKILQFYNFNLPASIYLNSMMQKRFNYKEKPIRISFYEEMLGNGQARTFIVFVFSEAEKYTYQPAANEIASDKVYDIVPDFAVQYLK